MSTTAGVITADSMAGRVLLALLAGDHTPGELDGRVGSAMNAIPLLIRAGLVVKDHDGDGNCYRITPAGRAACPFRNQLAAKAAQPEVFTMPRGETKLTRQQVLAAIVEAGADGITRAALVAKFAHLAADNAIDMHVTALNRQLPPVIFKPKLGLLVAIAHQGAAPAPEIGPETTSTAAEDWVPEPLATDADQVKPDFGAAALVQKLGQFPTIAEDLTLDDPDTVEFAIYSSGGLDIYCEDCAITLQRPVLAKLRAFLGLIAETA